MDKEYLYSLVKHLPLIDWHNHLDVKMLADDKPLGSLYEVWVKTDPYKHRVMRICGVAERLITGDAPEHDKWNAWVETLPKLVGNPLFAWAELELKFLGIDGKTNVQLSDWTPSKLLKKFNVEYISPCVTADALPDMACFHGLREKGINLVPSLRLNAGDDIAAETLEKFHAAGCRIVDISADDAAALNSCFHKILPIASFAERNGWTMLLHIGALRSTSARLRSVAGPAGGFAAMRSAADPAIVSGFLDLLEEQGALPRTVLMTLNPLAHAQLAVLAGSFVEEGIPSKVQLGPAWWWCDHAEGMRDVFEKQAAYGVLSTFVGMTTDSRSLLSFVRHDYFRRVFCKWVADKIATGDFPDDESLARPMLENVCYLNAHEMTSSAR